MLFRNFPKTSKLIGDKSVELTDIVRKVVFDDSAIESGTLYTEYKMRDGDTLESVARRVYGKEELSWVLMIFNRYIDPFYSPSLSTVAFDNYMNEKYDGQTLFVSAAGSPLPYNVDGAGITTGTLIMKKVTNDDGSVSYRNEPRGTIKSFSSAFGSLQLTKQVGKFSAGDTISILQDRVEVISALVQKVIDFSREAPQVFAQAITGASAEPLNPLGTIPDIDGQQFSIGVTGGTYNTGPHYSDAVTFGNTLLHDFVYNNVTTYTISNEQIESFDNEEKSKIKVLDPSFNPNIELQMRDLLRNA